MSNLRKSAVLLVGLALLGLFLLLMPHSVISPVPAGRPAQSSDAGSALGFTPEIARNTVESTSTPKSGIPGLKSLKPFKLPPGSNPLDQVSMGITALPAGGPASYVMRDRNAVAFFGPRGEITLSVGEDRRGRAPLSERQTRGVQWGMLGAQEVEPQANREMPGRVSIFRGEQSQWAADQKAYGSVVYDDIRPGVELSVDSLPHGYKYTVQAAAGADLSNLRFQYRGAESVKVTEGGASLLVSVGRARIVETGLVCYQDAPGGRRPVEARYVSLDNTSYEIVLGAHDPDLPLTIDPAVGWSTFLGGTKTPGGDYDQAYGIAVDASGMVYVAGTTQSPDFPVTGPDITLGGYSDSFIVKIDPAGGPLTAIKWCTFLGGSQGDYVNHLALDSSGNVYVTGSTDSSDFPITLGPVWNNGDSFVTKLNTTTGAVMYSRFLGGSSSDYANRIAVDGSGNAYVAGYTYSADFNMVGGFDLAYKGNGDGFVVRVNTDGTIGWSTYLGGADYDVIKGIAVDGSGNVYVGGLTYSTDFHVLNAYRATNSGSADAFVAKISTTATTATLIWSTYIGGTAYDNLEALAIDTIGGVYITGSTYTYAGATNYPTTGFPYQNTLAGAYTEHAFISKFTTVSGVANLAWSTFLGGASTDHPLGIAVDVSTPALPKPIVVGYTYSNNFPVFPTVAPTAYDTSYNGTVTGASDVFVTKFNATGNGLVFSTFVGGTDSDYPWGGVALDNASPPNVYVTGATYSTNFPTSPGTYKSTLSGYNDVFIFKLKNDGTALPWSTYIGGASSVGNDSGQDVAVDASGNIYVTGWTQSSDFPTVGPLGTTYHQYYDVFVTKYAVATPNTYTMAWSGILGGSTNDDYPYSIAVDASNNVYITGYTYSSDYPTAGGFLPPASVSTAEVFVTKINSTGNSLGYSRYLSGSNYDYGYGIAVDSSGNAYVTGSSSSPDFTNTLGGLRGSYDDLFVVKLNNAGNITWSTFLGGNDTDIGFSIKADSSQNVYVGGYSYSTDFPGAGFRPSGNGAAVVLVKLNSGGSLNFSKYIDGTDYETLYDMALDGNNPPNIYLTGYTQSTNFPVTLGSYSTTMTGSSDVFVAKLDNTGTMVWCTFLGGTNYEIPARLCVDSSGSVFVAGTTYSFDFPVKNAVYPVLKGGADVFVTRINPDGKTLAWSTFLGGSNYENAYGIGLTSNGSVVVVGYTGSSDFPMANALDSGLNGQDAFVTRFDNTNPFPPAITGQFRWNGGAIGPSISVGGWTNEANIVVKATIGDPEEDRVQLAVEIQPIDVAFTNTATVTSALVTSGTLVSLTVPLPAGTPQYHWQCRTLDALGKFSAWVSFGSNADLPLNAARDVGKDTVAPIVNLSTPTTGTTYTTPSSPISVTGSVTEAVSGVTSVTYTYNGAGPFSAGGTTSWSIGSLVLSAGPVLLQVTATDGAGNVGIANLTITYDTAPPAVAISSPASGTRTGASSIPVNGTATDNYGVAGVTWSTDRGASGTATPSGPPTNLTWTATVALSPGINNLTVVATDNGGLTNSTSRPIYYDNVPPSLTIVSPLSGSIVSGVSGTTTVLVQGTATDPAIGPSVGTISSVTWTNSAIPAVDQPGSLGSPPNWSALVTLVAGANPITIKVTDGVGNVTSAGITVYLDTQNPGITITSPVSGVPPLFYSTGSSSITIGGTATDDLNVATVTWVNSTGTPVPTPVNTLTGPANSKSWTATISGLSSAVDNVITFTVSDAVPAAQGGPKTSTAQITIHYDTTAPSITVVSPPTANHVTSTAHFPVSGLSGDNVSVNAITVQNLTTGVFSALTLTGIGTPSATWSGFVDLVIGTNTVSVVATDNTSLSTTVTLTITLDPNPPAVTITGPTGADTYVSGVGTIGLSGVASDNRGVTQVAWALTSTGNPPLNGVATLTGPPTSLTWNVASIPLYSGLNHITVTASDQALNSSTDTLDVTYDTTAPTIKITSPTSAAVLMTQVSPQPISGNASDVGSTIATVNWSKTSSSGSTSGTAALTPSGGSFLWDAGLVPLDPGANVFTVIATDAAGNTRSDSITIFLDNTKPTVLITSPTSTPTMSTTAATVTLGGLAGDNVQLQTVNWQNVSSSGTHSGVATGTTFWSTLPIPLDVGDNVITVTATDGAGNVSDPKTLTVNYDNSPPTLTISNPVSDPSSTTTTPAVVGGTAGDNVGVTEVTWTNTSTGGTGIASGTTNWSALCPLTSGVNDIQITARDAAGNTTTLTRTITYDPAAPFIAISSPTTALSFTTGATPITISGTADDDVGVASVTWTTDASGVPPSGGASLIPGTNGWTTNTVQLAPGSQVLTFTATDGVGRTGTTRITIVYDPVAPQVTISAPSAQPTYLSKVTPIALGGIAIDNLSLQVVKWVNTRTGENGTTTGVGVWTVPTVNLLTGDNLITVTATDSVGNTGSASITIIYDGQAPTVAITTLGTDPFVDPYPTTTRPLLISGTAGDNLNLTSVIWSNSRGGGGTATLVGTPTAATWSASVYLYATATPPTDNVITVTASDAHGNTTSTSVTIQFTPENGPPTINITSPTILTSPTQVVTISGDAGDNVGVVSVTWRNRTTGVRGSAVLTGPANAVTWSAGVPLTNGSNMIVFTATDDAGNTSTANITIDFTTPADLETPTVDVTGPTLTGSFDASSSPLLVTLSATDNIGVASIAWTNSGTGGAGVGSFVVADTWTATVGLALGVNTLTFTAYDAAGNSATTQLVVNFLPPSDDGADPTIAIVTPTSNPTLNVVAALLTLGGTASDNTAVAEVVWDNTTTGTSGTADGLDTWLASMTLTPGLNIINVKVYDVYGRTALATIQVTYSPPAPVIPAGHCGLLGLEGVLLVALIRRLARRR